MRQINAQVNDLFKVYVGWNYFKAIIIKCEANSFRNSRNVKEIQTANANSEFFENWVIASIMQKQDSIQIGQ